MALSPAPQVDRAHYARYDPYDDSPQPIGHGATISAPHMHAHACESLLQFLPLASAIASSTSSSSSAAAASPSAPSAASASAARPPLRILDIGSGSGYLTHVLAALAGPDARVVGLDHLAPLVELARANLRKSEDGRALLDSGRVKLVTADGRKGWPEDAPYDAIHVGAAASEAHSTLLEQLKAPGRYAAPPPSPFCFWLQRGGSSVRITVAVKARSRSSRSALRGAQLG